MKSLVSKVIGDLDMAPCPTALTREQTEEIMDSFTPELTREQSIFDHSEYGEGWEAMADHTLAMSRLDRIIFEDCGFSGSQVQAPHLNINDIPYYRRPEVIARKATISLQQARDLCQFWSTIGDTQPMVKEYLKWIVAKGIGPALKYFGNLAAQLSDAECVSPEEFLAGLEADPVAPNEYSYHPVGEREEEDDYYEDIAPMWMTRILQKMERAQSMEDLAEIGKKAFGAYMGSHTGTFWMHYNARKIQLTPKLSVKAKEIIAFIGACKTRMRLGKVGKRLYELQAESQRVEGNLAIADSDWTSIWEAYRERKESLNP